MPLRARNVVLAASTAFAIGAHAAENLLPPEQAFRFGARAVDTRTVEARFVMPPGYYLYRDKIRLVATPALGMSPPSLPPGEIKDDPFFGRVETYRDEVRVRFALPEGSPGASVVLEAESQGCADVGVCYPPNRQKVTLALPASVRADPPFVDAHPPRKSWFK